MEIDDLYHEFKHLVYNLALSYVQNVEDAEEITQDVFVAIYKSKDQFKYQSKISTWVYRIAVNQSLDFIKAKNRKKRQGIMNAMVHEYGSEDRSLLTHWDHPGVLLENKEALKFLFAMINRLPDKQKTVLILRQIEGLSPTETAEILNVSIKSMDSLYQRSKKQLAKNLKLNEEN